MLIALAGAAFLQALTDRVVYEPAKPNGKHVVLIAGDEEYRSEEALPQLAKILAMRHGFKCTVLFSLNASGEIDPDRRDHQPGLESLDSADLCVLAIRFRQWPDDQMRHFNAYVASRKPIIAFRTSTHAFNHQSGAYERYGWQSKTWAGGFGRQILGETWISHWGDHGKQATRGVSVSSHPILTGVNDVFGTTDVYEAHPPEDSLILMRGEVVAGMLDNDPPATGAKKTTSGTEQGINDPMMPIVWVRELDGRKVVTCTMGAATDFLNEGLRRLAVNASYWCVGMEPPKAADAALVGEYKPSAFGFGGFRKGVKPADHAFLEPSVWAARRVEGLGQAATLSAVVVFN